MNWGRSIILAFIGFAVFIGVLVSICVRQNISLVSKDYYKEELNYQEQIDQLANASSLADKPTIVISKKQVKVIFPTSIHHAQLKLLRPSDARFDAQFVVDSTTNFDLSKYPSGHYNASLKWEDGGKTYLLQESINL